jgi:hypothetical protein
MMKITQAAVKIDIDAPEIIQVKAAAAHIATATGRKPTVKLWGLFSHRNEEVFADMSPIQPLGYDARGRVKAEVDGSVIGLSIVRIDRATITL